jgi:hypothetical protein
MAKPSVVVELLPTFWQDWDLSRFAFCSILFWVFFSSNSSGRDVNRPNALFCYAERMDKSIRESVPGSGKLTTSLFRYRMRNYAATSPLTIKIQMLFCRRLLVLIKTKIYSTLLLTTMLRTQIQTLNKLKIA